MRKLLAANFSRLQKEKTFWLALAFMSLGAVCYSWISYNEIIRPERFAEDIIFCMLPVSSFVIAFFISMYLGTEFEEHTIRNRLLVGHSRTQVYFAAYITCMIASMGMMGMMLLFSTLFGQMLSLEFQSGLQEILLLFFCCMLLAAVFSAVEVGICMNVGTRAMSLLASTIFLFSTLLAFFCISALAEDAATQQSV